MTILAKYDRLNKLALIVGKLHILIHDDNRELDSLLERIAKRIEHYEDNTTTS